MDMKQWDALSQALIKGDDDTFCHIIGEPVRRADGPQGFARMLLRSIQNAISAKSERAYKDGKSDGFEEAYRMSDAEKGVAETLDDLT